MTRRAAGVRSRLEALEAREAQRAQAVNEENGAAVGWALALLSAADARAIDDAGRVLAGGEEPETLRRMVQACEDLPDSAPVRLPAKKEAEAWAEAALDVPEGVGLVRPPTGKVEDFAAYFETCAAWYDRAALSLPSPEARRLATWGAAFARLEAALCRVLGGQGGAA